MNIDIKETTLESFVNALLWYSPKEYNASPNVSVNGVGLGPRARMTQFDIVTYECGKVYEARGVSALVAFLWELHGDGRKIKSVTPVSIFAHNLFDAEYCTTLTLKPIETVILPGAIRPVPITGTLTFDSEVDGDPTTVEKTLAETTDEPVITFTPQGDNTFEEKVDTGEKEDILTFEEYIAMPKKELLKIVKDKGLKGNTQEAKPVLVERILAGGPSELLNLL